MDIKYLNEPAATWTKAYLDNLALWASKQGCSDITFRPRSPVWVRKDGDWHQATLRPVNANEIYSLIDETSKNKSASARVKGGEQYDYAFEIKEDRFIRKRFRVNAAGCRDGYSSGATITIRMIPSIPPSLDELDIEKDLLEGLFPSNGLVLITGVMGTGKSTLLSSIILDIGQKRQKHIITFEQPIEFDLMGIPDLTGPLEQTEIPIHLKSFKEAPQNAARRAADVILVGESREPETMKGILELTEMGVAGYTTVHTRNVPETISRIINIFPSDQQKQIATTMINCLKCIVQQRLLPKIGGGRVAIREYLKIGPEERDQLSVIEVDRLVPELWMLLKKKGVTLLQSAQNRYEAGLIDEESLKRVRDEYESSKQ